MNKSTISISQTGVFSDIFVDYIEGQPALKPFYKYTPDVSSFKQAIADKSKESIDRKLLVEVLQEQYSAFNLKPETLNLKQLEEPNTFTVCTGHQLCLFTGPLYFIYKIISTINLAEELKKSYPAYNFVPVYWMATEDHDFEEINHANIFGKKIVWDKESAVGNRHIAAGRIGTGSLTKVIEELKLIVGDTASAKQLITLVEQSYLSNSNLADATRYLVHNLFGKYGLIIVDANDTRLKKQFAEIIKDDLVNQKNYKIVNSTIKQLSGLKYRSQVNPRELNFFYLKDGERRRIVNAGLTSLDGNTEVALTPEMLKEIDTNPERFSPNVVLRPLYQQKILPNLAYVGGPGEIAYWLEYKAMFEYHKINFPVLVPRNFVMIIDHKSALQWNKLGFKSEDYFRDADGLIKEHILKHSQIQLSLEAEQKQLEGLYAKIAAQAEQIDPTLKTAVLAEQQKGINALRSIEAKLLKAEKQKSEIVVNQIKKIKEKLFPGGVLQERYDNFIAYYLIYGEEFIDILKKELTSFDAKLIVLSE
ncbi:MAG: bacillithiol biosynthesis cysteine-adding enzyme BshC [Bacteroidetes bacterium]|nr:bacillithiol biosynthesis cysteine-adding enzyme BshC [Bacteroidota bacterium]